MYAFGSLSDFRKTNTAILLAIVALIVLVLLI